jgi:hypothetical protein
MLTPRPAAGPSHALLQLLLRPANTTLSGDLLFGLLDPANELIPGQRRDIRPGTEGHGVVDQGLTEVSWKLVHNPTR